MYALYLADDGRILHATYEKYATKKDANGETVLLEGYVLVDDMPEGNLADYRYVDGMYVHDPLPKEEPQAEPTTDDVLNALLGVTE